MDPALCEDDFRQDGSEPPPREVTLAGPGSFRFSCTLCGDCCTGSQVVRLTQTDLSALVARLGLRSVRDLRSLGLVSLVREPLAVGHSVWRPRIRFRTHPLRQCPFLVNDVGEDGIYRGLCSLHPDFKPLVCRLSPLAREVDDPGSGPVQETWSAVAPVDGCPGMGQGHPTPLGPPSDLLPLLHDEVAWIRALAQGSGSCPDEESAWNLLVSLVPGR